MTERLMLLVSPCLRGRRCRYDGRSKPVSDIAGNGDFDWVELCPERLGFGGGHEPVNRVEELFLGRDSGRDYTGEFRRGVELAAERLPVAVAGAVLKAKSPSCGIGTVPIYDRDGGVKGYGSGLWAEFLSGTAMPLIDENGWSDPEQKEEFLARCRKYSEHLE